MEENIQSSKITPILKTTLACAVMVFISAQRHAGIVLLFFLLFLIPSLIKSFVTCIRDSRQTKMRLSKSLIWIAGIIIVFTVHVRMHHESRQIASKVAAAVELYKTNNGVYPRSSEQTGVPRDLLRESRIYFSSDSGKPFLMYPVTFMPFDTYHYDFETKEWDYFSS